MPTYTLSLSAGWSLFGLQAIDGIVTASQLAEIIGPKCTLISKWDIDEQGWESYVPGVGGDFLIDVCHLAAFSAYLTDSVTTTYSGTACIVSISIIYQRYLLLSPGQWVFISPGTSTIDVSGTELDGKIYEYIPEPIPVTTLLPGHGYAMGKPITCAVTTDKDTYVVGETITISYSDAPPNSWLWIEDSNGVGRSTWTPIEGSSSVTYTIPTAAPAGTWTIYLQDTGCSTSKTIVVSTPTLKLIPTKTIVKLDEEFCPEVECAAGIDNVCIYIDGIRTDNCADSGLLPNIKCKPVYPDDFDKITGADLGGIGTHTLQAKTATLASNIVNIEVVSEKIGEITDVKCTSAKQMVMGGYEIEATVTVKNTNAEDHSYKVKLYDAITSKLLNIEPDIGREIKAGETKDFSIGTTAKWGTSSTPKTRYDLLLTHLIEPDEVVDTRAIDCVETEPSFFDLIIKWLALVLGISESSAALVLYGGIALFALVLILSIVK